MLTAVVEIARYRNNSLPSLDGFNKGGLLKYGLSSWNAVS